MFEEVILLAAYVLVGIASGLLGGLLGIGGGVVSVPCLYYIFYFRNYPHSYLMLIAISTSLAAMVFNTASATWAHHKRASVLWSVFQKMALGLIGGSVLGALVAKRVPETILEVFFGIFLCILAIKFWKKGPSHEESHPLPKGLFLWGVAIGGISNILGIGGGTLIVPLLVGFKVPPRKAIGTSAACSLVVTCIGTLTYFILGLHQVHLPNHVGYINLPAFITIGVVSFFTAPFGVKWAHELPVERIKKIFACVLILTGVCMMI